METTHLSPSPAFNNTLTPPQRQHKFFQLAQSQCMSPSMMTSCAPSPDQSDAFVPMSASSNEYWANSAVQGYVQDSEHLLPVSRPNLSIPDASNQDTSMHNKANSMYRSVPCWRRPAGTHGSPNRYIGKSPNPADGGNPWVSRGLGAQMGTSELKGMHESICQDGHAARGHEILYTQPNYPREPKIHAESPDTVAKVRELTTLDNNTEATGISPWNNSIFDERWIATPEKMFTTGARRTSILTVSPDESSPSRYSPGFGENAALYTRLVAGHLNPTQDSSSNGKMDNTSLSGGEIPLPNTTPVRRTSNHTFSTISPSPPNLPNPATTKKSSKNERMEPNRMCRTNLKIFPVPPEVHRFKESLRRLSGDNNELPLINIENVPEVRQTFYASVFGDSSGLPPSEKDRAEELVDIDGQQFPRRVIMETLLLGIENTLRKMTRKLPVESDQQERNLARPSDEGLNPSYHLNGYSNTQGNVCLNTQGSQAVYLEPQVRPQNPRVVNADLARHPTGSLENISSFENLSLSHPEGKSLHSLSFGSEEETKMFRSRHILKPEDDVNLIRAEAKALPTAAPGITSKDHARLTFGPFQQLPPGLQQQQVLQFLPQAGSLYHQYDINGSPVTWQSPSIYPPSSVFTNFPGRQVVHPSPGLPPYGLQAFVPQQFPPNTPSILPQSPLFRDVGSTPISSAAYIGQIQEHGPPWRSVYPQPSCSPSPLWMQGLSPRNNDPSRIESPRSNEWSTRTGGKVVPAISKLPFRPGSDDMYPRPIVRGASVKFQELVREEVPTFEHFMRPDLMPFAENARNWKAVEWGVLKISNIPYSLTKQEILGFLGRNAKIVTPDLGVAIHIIMERSTGKTMDSYVEFFSKGDAQAALNKCTMRGTQLRLGERIVDIAMSSQDELLKELFPRAKNTRWENGQPIIEKSTEPFNSGFKGFISHEELLQIVVHAEKPHRSNYTQKCLQRPYECMVSILAKFPWFDVDHYTITTRDQIFKSTKTMINMLVNQLKRGGEGWAPNVSESLLTEVLLAGLNAPAFSERQRWELCHAAEEVGQKVRLSPLAHWWPFHVLGRKAGFDEDLVDHYAKLISTHHSAPDPSSPFGALVVDSKQAAETKSVGELGQMELDLFQKVLSQILERVSYAKECL